MVSWHTEARPRSCLSRPAICCGDQPSLSRPTTCARRLSSAISLRRRRRRCRAQVLRGEREVAAEAAVAVPEAVAAEFAVDGGRVAPEPLSDLADGPAGLHEPEEGASRIEV